MSGPSPLAGISHSLPPVTNPPRSLGLSHFIRPLWVFPLAFAAAFWAACEPDDEEAGRRAYDPDGGAGGSAKNLPPGGDLADEQFPPALLEPYTGPPINVYDNTFVSYLQLKARVARVFADTKIGGDTEAYFAAKLPLLGGADFKTEFTEARVASQDFLLALDAVAKDACDRAASNKTGPFAGADPENVGALGDTGLATQLVQRMLFRAPIGTEASDFVAFEKSLESISPSKTSAWAGVCEVLVRHPDSLFTLPPSVAAVTGPEKTRMQITKLAVDLLGRPPSDAELTSLADKTVDQRVDALTALPEFRDFFFHRVRIRLESIGTPESDEPARLWTYLVMNDAPMQDLLAANYTVDEQFNKVSRPPEHGPTGVLTMKGYIRSKAGLPHYNYAARVMTDFMGQLFEVPADIIAQRVNATATTTVMPKSVCISCHGVLTPLATQRLRWADDGTYRTTDDAGAPIDDSDRNLVPDYPYKGQGMGAFATQAVKKERFFRQTFQALFLFFLGRQMRYSQDERTVYLAMWKTAFSTHGNTRALIKVVANLPTYLGN